MKQLTTLVAKAPITLRRPGSRGRPMMVNPGDRFWVTTSQLSNDRTQTANIEREGRGQIGTGHNLRYDDIAKYFEVENNA